MGYLIEYDGDDSTILHKAIEWAAERGSLVAQVTLRPSAAGRPRDITSVADYLLSGYLPVGTVHGGTVLLTLFDHNEADLQYRHPNGKTDHQRVPVDDIAEIHFY